MSSEVKVLFIGDPTQLFRVTDQVEARIGKLGNAITTANPLGNISTTLQNASPKIAGFTNQIVSGNTAIESSNKKLEISMASLTAKTKELTQAERNLELQQKRGTIAVRGLSERLAGEEESRAATLGHHQIELQKRRQNAGLTPPALSHRIDYSQFLPPEATMAADLGKALGITALGAATAGGVAVAGYALVKWTETVKEKAEKRLAIEEKIQETYNAQAESLKQQIASGEKLGDLRKNITPDPYQLSPVQFALSQIQQTRLKQGFGFGEGGAQTLTEWLKPTRALRDYSKEIEKASNNAIELGSILSRLQKGEGDLNGDDRLKLIQVAALQIDERKRAQTGFSDKDIADNKKFFEEQHKKEVEAFEDRKKAIEQVNELGKTVRSTFDDLFQKRYSDNPFSQQFLQADRDLTKLRENVKGLPLDLQKAAIDTRKAIDSNQLFRLRVDTAFEAQDLRFQAREIRKAIGPDFNRLAAQAIVLGDPTLARNPRHLRDLGLSTEEYGLYRSPALARTQGNLNADPTLFRNPATVAIEAVQEQQRRFDQGRAPAIERLDKQIGLANLLGRGAENEDQRAIAEARIAGLGRGVDPTTLRGDQREAIATAIENQAKRAEDREKTAQDLRQKQYDLDLKIEEHLKVLRGIAETEGTKSIQGKFIFEDRTKDGVEVEARPKGPTQKSVTSTYFDEANPY
jgi:hypothetical protein